MAHFPLVSRGKPGESHPDGLRQVLLAGLLAILCCLSQSAATTEVDDWHSIGPEDGWIISLAMDPHSPSTLYAGALSGGGVFKSTDGGESWAVASNGLPNNSIWALATDPQVPETLYAGVYGEGVFRSMDGGASWTTASAGLTNRYVMALAVDPQTPSILYAGTFGGVLNSVDDASWRAMNNGLTNAWVWSMAVDPQTPSTVYAGTAGGGVFKIGSGTATPTHSPSPSPTATASPTRTCTPTAPAPRCVAWERIWGDEFEDPLLPLWQRELAVGSAVVTDSTIQLRGQEDASTAFPLLWSQVSFPEGDYELEIRFRYGPPTAYGTTIGVGSAAYDGARYHQDDPAIPNIEDVLSIHQFAGGFWARLWDEVAWQSLPPDTCWHVARVVREGATYSLFVDGSPLGSVTRTGAMPRSVYLGNPTIERFAGPWTPLGLDYVRITICSTWGSERLRLPLVLR